MIEQEQKLEEELKAKQAELAKLNESNADIDEKIDSSIATSSEIDSIREKILQIWDEIDSLIKEIDKMIEEQPGKIGDFEGTKAIIGIKMRKIEELKGELDELGEQT